MHYPVSRSCSARASVFILLLSIFPTVGWPSSISTIRNAAPTAPGAIVIGFVGGFVGRNNTTHNEVRLAKGLRDEYPSGLQVRMFENRRGRQARLEVLRLLDTDNDGVLSPEEKKRARIAIYGHSWGASEAVTLARALARDKIPVLLTAQVDSVQKPGEDDEWIPPNVTQAVNFYQADGLLHGRSLIRAADVSRTQILGNYRSNYKTNPVSCQGYPWYARLFMRPHIEIECDPAVWREVGALIRSRLSLP
jgi:hypothetical protein